MNGRYGERGIGRAFLVAGRWYDTCLLLGRYSRAFKLWIWPARTLAFFLVAGSCYGII